MSLKARQPTPRPAICCIRVLVTHSTNSGAAVVVHSCAVPPVGEPTVDHHQRPPLDSFAASVGHRRGGGRDVIDASSASPSHGRGRSVSVVVACRTVAPPSIGATSGFVRPDPFRSRTGHRSPQRPPSTLHICPPPPTPQPLAAICVRLIWGCARRMRN